MISDLPDDQRRSDADIAHDVVNALLADRDIPSTIKPRVQDRWIWLLGEASDESQRRAAEGAAERIAGAKGVTNLVRIRRPASG